MNEKINKQEEKRYWLRGGLIGAVIGILLNIITPTILTGTLIMIMVVASLFGFDAKRFENMGLMGGIIAWIVLMILFFLIGAHIGHIYGKIKERKTK